MVDNVDKNLKLAQKLRDSQKKMADKIYKEIVKDARDLANYVRKKDFAKLAEVATRIHKNSQVMKS